MRRLGSAVEAVFRYRRPDPECWDTVITAVIAGRGNWDTEHALMQAGRGVCGQADRLARALTAVAPSGGAVTACAYALAGMGDSRAVPALERSHFPFQRLHAHTLARLPAAELLPTVRAVLRKPERHRVDIVLEVLAAWGPAAGPAVPEVVPFLETEHAYQALRALGRIGPAAAVAADRLAGFATGRDPRAGRHHLRRAAWAHWRVTGDDTLALAVCGAAAGSGSAGNGLPFLADLGPAASRYAGTVRGLMESPGAWIRTAAAHAYWRITGDPEPAVPVLLAAVDPAWTGNPAQPVREAVRHLGEIGPAAAVAAPRLRGILASERRLEYGFRGVSILMDEMYTRTLAEALARIDR
ncbi:hypothetical protein ACGFYU_13650 [Streptomyces sp. NPDC048337]|uniref:hypothetical protein n=1 Tax=Streptomyces sp. NPDC048337 TaxID=3365535 RepID=UPI0037105FCA